jgi:hypothetical protein
VQVALLRGAADLLPAGGARDVAPAGRQRLENRVEAPDGLVWAADHHAIATLQTPDPAACPDVHIMDLLRGEFLGTADVVHIVGVAAVDEDVAGLEMG